MVTRTSKSKFLKFKRFIFVILQIKGHSVTRVQIQVRVVFEEWFRDIALERIMQTIKEQAYVLLAARLLRLLMDQILIQLIHWVNFCGIFKFKTNFI